MTQLNHAVSWTGVSAPVWAGLQTQTGPLVLFREVAHIPEALWTTAVAAVVVQPPEVEGVAPAERPILPVEAGHVGALRRVARMRVGLRPHEVVPSTIARDGGIPGTAPPGGSASGSAAVVGGVQQRKLKMAGVLDQADDTEVVPLDPKKGKGIVGCFQEGQRQ